MEEPKKHHPGSKGTDAMNKRTPEEKEERFRQVYEANEDMIGQGMSFSQRFKALAKQFQVSEQQGKNYISLCKAHRKKLREEMAVETREDAISQYDYLYREAMRTGNRKEARECLAEKVKLMGLAAPKRVESVNVNASVAGPEVDFSRYSVEQLRQIQEAQVALQHALTGTKPGLIELPAPNTDEDAE